MNGKIFQIFMKCPGSVLDLAVSKKIEKNIEIKASIKDILNQQVKLVQPVSAHVDMNSLTKGDIKEQNTSPVIRLLNLTFQEDT